MPDRNGYIGRSPGDSSTIINREQYTVTSSSQSTFNFGAQYIPGYLDIYVNGTRLLENVDYTANDGGSFTLTVAAGNLDVVEAVAYKAFNLVNAPTVGIKSDGLVIGNAETLNFIGTGNTFLKTGSVIDISIDGGGGSGFSSTSEYLRLTGAGIGITVDNNAKFTGNLEVQGVLTYADVTNVDSLGIVTAQSGVRIPAGGMTVAGVSTFNDIVSVVDKIEHQDNNATNIRFPAINAFAVEIGGGESLRINYGDIKLTTSGVERLRLASSGQIGLAGANYGTAGQVITSNGSGSAPTWQAPVAGLTTEAFVKTTGQTAVLQIGSAVDHKVTCTGTVTIDAEGGTADDNEGESHTIRIINNGTATVGFSTFFLFPSGAAPSLPTADGAISLISFTVNRVGAGGTQLLAGVSVNYS
tara:strand:- start:718 stop:1956 length:1239 start_codon:yes stop_codon:yes gene_type:complete